MRVLQPKRPLISQLLDAAARLRLVARLVEEQEVLRREPLVVVESKRRHSSPVMRSEIARVASREPREPAARLVDARLGNAPVDDRRRERLDDLVLRLVGVADE